MNPVSPLADALPRFKRDQYALAAHLRDPARQPAPEGMEDRRLAVYRELLFNNIEGFISGGFPVLRAITADEPWYAMVRDFFAHHSARTPYFKDISREFLDYLENERDNPSDPPFLLELAHYERAEVDLEISEAEPHRDGLTPDGDLLDQCPALSPLVMPLSYNYPVHEISPEFIPSEPRQCWLVVYRNRDDEVGFLEVNPVTLRLLLLLEEGWSDSGRALLSQIATEMNHPDPQAVIDGGALILQDLAARDIILGSLPL